MPGLIEREVRTATLWWKHEGKRYMALRGQVVQVPADVAEKGERNHWFVTDEDRTQTKAAAAEATPPEAEVVTEPNESQPEPSAGLSDEEINAMSVAAISDYVGLHPDELDRVQSLEEQRAEPRKGVLQLIAAHKAQA